MPALALLASFSFPKFTKWARYAPRLNESTDFWGIGEAVGPRRLSEKPTVLTARQGQVRTRPEKPRRRAQRRPGWLAGWAGQAGRAGQRSEKHPGHVGNLCGVFQSGAGPRLETKWKQWKLWNASKVSLGAGPCTKPYGSGGDEDSCLNLF